MQNKRNIWEIDREGKVLLNPETKKICPKLNRLSDNELLFIILVYDHRNGPYWKLPLDERIQLSIKNLGLKGDLTEKLSEEIKEFKSINFDERLETIDAYKRRLRKERKLLLDEDSSRNKIKSISDVISFLESEITRLESDFESEEKNLKIKGDRKLSCLEIWQRRQMEHSKYNET